MSPAVASRARVPVRWFAVAVLVVGLSSVPAVAQPDVPPLTGRVVDLTGTLDAAAVASLTDTLADLEARRGSQIAVLLVPTTSPESIEQYALRVAEAWELGRAGVDDGVLLLVAKDDRALRVEVGYGLEGAVPDALANRIIDERIVPRFYRGDFAGGLHDGVEALVALVDGEPLPPPAEVAPEEPDVLASVLFLVFGALVVSPLFRLILGRLPGAAVVGGVSAIVAWWLVSLFALALVVGVVVFVMALGGSGGPGRWASGGESWSRGGVRRGRRARGSGGGFSGGFSGGGGRFGGGGASGRW